MNIGVLTFYRVTNLQAVSTYYYLKNNGNNPVFILYESEKTYNAFQKEKIYEIQKKKKKIGVLTFQCAHNYGAILQCYALQELLKQNDYEVEVINYVPKVMKNLYHYFSWYRLSIKHPKWAFMNIVYILRRKRRYDVFNEFINSNLDLSDSKVIEHLLDCYDTVIIGSDQVWNIKNTSGAFDYYYWGQFQKSGKPRIISYAASMGGSWKDADWMKISSLLNNFNSISVRENFLKKCIEEKCNRIVEWVLDPTLLQNRDFWSLKARRINIKEPYLFYYQARYNHVAFEFAKHVADIMKLKFICLSAEIMLYNSPEVINSDPFDFLGLIKNAQYVITSSFHGTVFCYQFKKNFSTLILNDGDDGRNVSFLSMLGLENRLISIGSNPVTDIIDWKSVDKRISEMKSLSLKWLYSNL